MNGLTQKKFVYNTSQQAQEAEVDINYEIHPEEPDKAVVINVNINSKSGHVQETEVLRRDEFYNFAQRVKSILRRHGLFGEGLTISGWNKAFLTGHEYHDIYNKIKGQLNYTTHSIDLNRFFRAKKQ
ncbi:DUF5064 family protein [Zooshikella marina]|uniref:DUF5064 family protein n=1 Tax=Zooshikella ganghwensis TaxID=202772 RepID=A0A4P9VMY2_9GAMM|nr:DUF5064 family protein [Zooshikella ganghwensis]MBU2708158.1 DUF5064 family protein [Zooshikella ganghwensis]RDH44788.1 DUF5064 family protein [Zooshikella ganghwensis]